jgi:hypothetical protein
MYPAYDIFKQSIGNRLLWIERFRSLSRAKQRVASLGLTSAAEKYFIYDVRRETLLQPLAE